MTSTQQISAIDNLIERQYLSGNYSELAALSKLFKDQFLIDLEAILNVNSRKELYYKERFEVSCGWIDKIPLAKFTHSTTDINGNKITGKMELGDLLLIYTHNNSYQTDKGIHTASLQNRAVIVQAKIAKNINPRVPIGRMQPNYVNSTSKELALLSSWPEFDLYQTSKSLIPLLTNVSLDNSKPNAKFAGFFLKKWYVGNPSYAALCNKSLGDLIISMTLGSEGEDFDTEKTGDWNSLIKKLIEICGKYSLPNFLFGGSAGSRLKEINRNPLFPFFIFFGKQPSDPIRFPILVINKISVEGKL